MTDTPAAKPEKKPNVYKDTVFLPKTAFPMKAGLPKSEPEWLARWKAIDLYARQRAAAKDRPLFVQHDGPPYANGNIHLGTAFNKILKDFVSRSQNMLGRNAPYVHGWDCHGLPIEWKVEEQYRAKGKNKDDIPVSEFRAECRAFAGHWLDVQRTEFRRLGGTGDWDHPYTTMDYRAEARIVDELLTFARHGLLYRGSKPVMWSPVERTALAEAEIEYHDKNSPQIWVKFPVAAFGLNSAQESPTEEDKALMSGVASVVIWTTTPWTIPANRAISYSPSISYGLYRVEEVGPKALAQVGENLLLADKLAENVFAAGDITKWSRVSDISMEGRRVVCRHPFYEHGYEFDVPLLSGEHVTDDTGTGFVHTAPGHGVDDYEVWLKSGRSSQEIPDTVGPEGEYLKGVRLFEGLKILKDDGKDGPANAAVIEKLKEVGALLASGRMTHSYPHSWRSRAPIIFRNTPQWFAPMDKPFTVVGEDAGAAKTLRARALESIDATAFYPAQGRNRLRSMVETRPDWVLSRQRAWGVPLTLFVNKASGEVLVDEAVNKRIVDAITSDGADAWYVRDPQTFLGEAYKAADYEQVKDILDVWFDSGSTHAFVLDKPIQKEWTQGWPADLYLEGSDQHRGWFQSSLLQGCGTRGRAPFRAIATHGFIVDGKGLKMSKSLGNTISPVDVANEQGADILRMWVSTADYGMDPPLDKTILAGTAEAYRKLRNTLRYLLGALDGYTAEEAIDLTEMPELERYMLHRLAEVGDEVRAGFASFDFIRVSKAVGVFATNDLSAFYFDIRKDALYCDDHGSIRRRASRTVMDLVFHALVTWLAPILPFTTEEAFLTRFPSEDDSVHLRTFYVVPDGARDDELAKKWDRIRALRRTVTGALEIARRDKVIGASLEAAPTLTVANVEDAALFEGLDLAEISITSEAAIAVGPAPEGAFTVDDVFGAAVTFAKAEGAKCVRCWRVLPEVGSEADHAELCRRCAGAVRALPSFAGAA
ncbi:Isoleucine--tRNA ligase [Alphaproteobacteria bacterium SO-S41]|nr:Isoleucine--tRNA ligase [Alphaproteobacteria bacterium SO-S41]